MKPLPKITVVTPSFNQASFLEQTICSVLGQGYPNLEYIIMDGGSSDGSVEIIRKYEKQLAHWESRPDGGQGNGINRGFALSSGEILAWLNSDDFYLPGTLFKVAQALDLQAAHLVFGNCLHIRENSPDVRGSDVALAHATLDLELVDYLIQPSCFWTRLAWQAAGPLDQTLHYLFDWDWFLRAEKNQVTFTPETTYLSVYRLHHQHKTGSGGNKRTEEIAEVIGRNAGTKMAELYLGACRKSKPIADLTVWAARLRVWRWVPVVLRLRFPGLFGQLSDRQLLSVLQMIEPWQNG